MLPRNIDILYLGLKGGKESIWILLDPEDTDLVPYTFKLIRTDEEIPTDMGYLGSLQVSEAGEDVYDLDNYDFMYHVFCKQS